MNGLLFILSVHSTLGFKQNQVNASAPIEPPVVPLVHIVSGTMQTRPWTENTTRNHILFASLHDGFDYTFVSEDMAPDLLNPRFAPQWLKIRVLQEAIRKRGAKGHPYILWLDDDIVITKPEGFVEEMIGRLRPEQDLLIASDAGDPKAGVNTGMMLIRSTARGMALLNKIWKMTEHVVPGGTLGTCQNQQCLHEQEALNLLLQTDESVRDAVNIVNPVQDTFNMNTFYRWTHHDPKRRKWFYYDEDPDEYRWDTDRGLNTCHVTGMEPELRMDMIQRCLQVADTAFMLQTSSALAWMLLRPMRQTSWHHRAG